jgi:UDP-glucose 4-epimerase
MNVLLTGGLGFIGSHTVVELVNYKYNVIIIDNLSNSKISVLENIYKLCDKNKITFYKGDILNNQDLNNVFTNIDIVIHFAAHKSVAESLKKPLQYYNNNINGLINLLNKCKEFNINKFIFSSSATIYGSSESPLLENSKTGTDITSPYGKTKYFSEIILQDYCDSNKNFNVISLRYFNPVGAHKSGLIGEDPNDIPNNLMPFILKVAKKNNLTNNLENIYDSLSIFGNNYETNDGTCERDFIHVVDLAKAHVKSCDKIGKINNYETFNIGTGNPISVLQLVNTFIKINKIKLPYIFKEKREGDNSKTYCNCSKALKILNWKSEYDIYDICKDSYNFIKKN